MSTAATIAPPSPSSDRRAKANRRNARRSTGLRTPQGKARSALNAVKTGCFARTPLLNGLARIFGFDGDDEEQQDGEARSDDD